MIKKQKLPNSNKEIKAEQVRLVNENGEMLGVFNIYDALNKAKNVGLDLVEISPNAKPPVCKIQDFGKYKYELQKRFNEARKNQKTIEVKEIKIRPNIGENDYNIKLKALSKFLNNGDKVKVSMRFRGREIVKQEIAYSLFNKILSSTEEFAKPEFGPKMESRQLLMILAPAK